MGNQRFQTLPATRPSTPKSSILTTFFADAAAERSQCPVSRPINVVPTAGMVLRIPSGSRVPSKRWPMKSLRSSHAARLRSGSMKGMSRPGDAQAGYGSETKQRPIPHEFQGDQLPPAASPEFEDGRDEIAQRDALRDSFESPGMDVEADDWRSVHKKPHRNEDQAPLEDVREDLRARLAAPGARRKRVDDRDADEKQKRRKDEVGGRPAIPIRVLDGPIGFVVAAGIIDNDHARNREAAEVRDIDTLGRKVLDVAGGGLRGLRAWLGCRHELRVRPCRESDKGKRRECQGLGQAAVPIQGLRICVLMTGIPTR